jgi:DNA polymerase V
MHVLAVWKCDRRIRLVRPLFVVRISAGFPSPAEDWVEGRLDMNGFLIRHPVATFYMRVEGDSMMGAGINENDILVIDRAIEAEDGHIVVARVNDEFTVKRLRIINGRPWLYPENSIYEPYEIRETDDFEVWGRVLHSITSH